MQFYKPLSRNYKNYKEMGKYTYSDSEQDMLKVLKLQEEDLEELEKETNHQSDDLTKLRKQTEALLRKVGINPANIQGQPVEDIKISQDEIPSWDSLVDKAQKKHPEDVILEDLLSKEEFNYCIAEVQRIYDDFERKTGIWNKKDMAFLIVATALQTLRWVLIQNLCGDLGQTIDSDSRLQHDDKSIKDDIKDANTSFQERFKGHGSHESMKSYKSWQEIIFSSVPYDTSVHSGDFGENLEGRYHRYKTLGHDPILGWLFGTANIITDTCTLSNLNSYRISRIPNPHFSEPTDLFTIFYESFDSVKEDRLRLPAAVFAQYVHLKSDAFTKLGLPIPIIQVFSESLAGDLYKNQYDSLCLLKDLAIVGSQAGFAILINMIIGLIHGLLYNPKKDGERRLYEVRTRKILLISNALSSAGNIVYSIISQDWRKLDIGGIIVTIGRLFTDTKFIARIKEEFINQQLDKMLEKEIKELDTYFV